MGDSSRVPLSSACLSDMERVRAAARYTAFGPHAMACAHVVAATSVVPSCSSGRRTHDNNETTTTTAQQDTTTMTTTTMTTKLALAGPHGIAVVSAHCPQTLLSVWQHYAPSLSSSSVIPHHATTSHSDSFVVAFSSHSQILAYASGAADAGVLLWDCSGTRLEPLLGRLPLSHVTSLTWKSPHILFTSSSSPNSHNNNNNSSSSSNNNPNHHRTSDGGTDVCAWNIQSSLVRPSRRYTFGSSSSNSHANHTSKGVAAVAAHGPWTALLDVDGTVRLYHDTPTHHEAATATAAAMGSTSSVVAPVATWQAFRHVGIGLAAIPNNNHSHNNSHHNKGKKQDSMSVKWMTWGMDAPFSSSRGTNMDGNHNANNNNGNPSRHTHEEPQDRSVVVKVWSTTEKETSETDDSQQWKETTTSSPWNSNNNNNSNHSYRQVAQFTTPQLHCARVCPPPFSGIVTVGATIPLPPLAATTTTTTIPTSSTAANSNQANHSSNAWSSWRAELWQLVDDSDPTRVGGKNHNHHDSGDSHSDDDDNNNNDDDNSVGDNSDNKDRWFGVRRVASFGNDPRAIPPFLGSHPSHDAMDHDFIGPLLAADLAIAATRTTSTTASGTTTASAIIDGNNIANDDPYYGYTHDGRNNDAMGETNGSTELVLCCLSQQGYLTTHAIPEASLVPSSSSPRNRVRLPPHHALPSSERVTPRVYRHVSGDATTLRANALRAAAAASSHDEAPLAFDPNSHNWSSHMSPSAAARDDAHHINHSNNNALYAHPFSSSPSSSSPSPELLEDVILATLGGAAGGNGEGGSGAGIIGGSMQFDIELEKADGSSLNETDRDEAALDPAAVAASSAQKRSASMSGPQTPTSSSAAAAAAASSSTVARSSTEAPIDPFQARRVPCPRLCGASFGMGGGGLVSFHNGHVGQMWTWFQSDPAFSSGGGTTLGVPNESTTTTTKMLNQTRLQASNPKQGGPTPTNDTDDAAAKAKAKMVQSKCPRTMLDLIRMTAAAKVAQWGNDIDDTSSSSSSSSSSMNSDASRSSDEEESVQDDDDDDDDGSLGSSGGAQSLQRLDSSVLRKPVSPEPANKLKKKSRDFVGGPSIEPLAPVVEYTHEHDNIILNGQCPDFANQWQLGPWWLTDDGDSPEALPGDAFQNTFRGVRPSTSRTLRPSNNADNDDANITVGTKRWSNDRNESLEDDSFATSLPIMTENEIKSEREHYATRSHRQESMIGNIRKLFIHHQDDRSALTFTPPDQKVMDKRRTNSFPPQGDTERDGAAKTDSTPKKLGEYTLSISAETGMRVDRKKKQMEKVKRMCIHNATICSTYHQTGKADTWSLLAQVVDNVLNTEPDNFDGWGGPGGGALGQELVSSILEYYEFERDVQMLASIICVLSGGRDRRRTRISNPPSSELQHTPPLLVLLPNDEHKHDSYIRNYCKLLYSWGQMEIRAELSKHLAYALPGAGGEQLMSAKIAGDGLSNLNENNAGCISNNGVAYGISFAPLCPRCNRPASPDTNTCSKCNDYAFRCAICTNAVRGFFTVCMACGHGGHVDHIRKWFEENTVCPSGCGCSCIFNTFESNEEKAMLPMSSSSIDIDGNPSPGQIVSRVGGSGVSSNDSSIRSIVPVAPMLLSTVESDLVGHLAVPFGAYVPRKQKQSPIEGGAIPEVPTYRRLRRTSLI